MIKFMKILTIIVPTYNMECYLDKCLSSLIIPDENLLDELEVLVINDGSKDSSSEIAHGYEVRYPGIFHVIDKENGNYGSCINRGLQEATGKYIKILDADDYFNTIDFAKFLMVLSSVDVDMVLTNSSIVDEEDCNVGAMSYISILKDREYYKFEDILAKGFANRCFMHNVTYKTENVKSLRYCQTEGIAYTDQEWIFMPMTLVKTVYYTNLDIYHYLLGRVGQTMHSDVLCLKFQDLQTMMFTLMREYEIFVGEDVYREYLFMRIIVLLHYSVYSKMQYEHIYKEEVIQEFDALFNKTYPLLYYKTALFFTQNVYLRYIQQWREGYFLFYFRILRDMGIKKVISIYLADCDAGRARPYFVMLLINKFIALNK
ncbi:MAG: glycosyltransferase [Prevotellaceae bacterium]|nr:glycosyltransferase [Prevotellaceae bacterium]